MKSYLVCEDSINAQLLNRILPEEILSDLEIVAAGGLSSGVKSMARSLVVRRQAPVAIVIDADSMDLDQVEERRRTTEEIVKGVASGTPVKVILAVPMIEAIFFQDIALLTRILGYEPSSDILDLAINQPLKALTRLISQSKHYLNQSQLIESLTIEDITILQKTRFIQEVIQFFQSVRETATIP
jgi:hypothetical protein